MSLESWTFDTKYGVEDEQLGVKEVKEALDDWSDWTLGCFSFGDGKDPRMGFARIARLDSFSVWSRTNPALLAQQGDMALTTKKVRNVQLRSVESMPLCAVSFRISIWHLMNIWGSISHRQAPRNAWLVRLDSQLQNKGSLSLQCLAESNLLFATIDCWVCDVFELPDDVAELLAQHLRKWVYRRWCVLWWLPAGCATCRVS